MLLTSELCIVRSIKFGKHMLKVKDVSGRTLEIPYEEMVMAYIEVCDKESENVSRVSLADISEDVDGELVICDLRHFRYRFLAVQTGKKAGFYLKQLALYAPYLLFDSESWLEEEDEEAFEEAKRMVSIMRELPH